MTLKENIQKADQLMKARQPQEAAQMLDGLSVQITALPAEEQAEFYSKLGVARILSGQTDKAIDAFLNAVEKNDRYVNAYLNLSLAYTQAHQPEKAVEYGMQGLSIEPDNLPLLKTIVNAMRLQGKPKKALKLLEEKNASDIDDAVLQVNYGTVLYEMGKKKKAADAFKKALSLSPDNIAAHRMLSLVYKYEGKQDPYFQMLLTLRQNEELPAFNKAQIDFAIAEAYESFGEYGRAFEAYKQGNKLKSQAEPFRASDEKRFIEEIKAVFTPEYVASFPHRKDMPKGAVRPIFIVGMPRSGTSLVEQILASHTKVYGAGELKELERLQFEKFSLEPGNFKESWTQISTQDLQKMSALYLEKIEQQADDEHFVTDKMPTNFLYCGVIARLFPDAKIIHCKRDPRASGFSIFKTYFADRLAFSNNQKDIAEYYKLYQDLMTYWREVMPDRIYEVEYEQIVQNPEENIKHILEYIGAEWQDDCLNFHETERAVTTASSLQVRQPIYKDALSYWKNFEPFMDPALLELKRIKE